MVVWSFGSITRPPYRPMPWTWQHIDTADVLTSIWFAMITMFESHDDGNDDDPQSKSFRSFVTYHRTVNRTEAFVEQIERLQLTTGSHLDQVPIRELQSFALYRHPWFTEKWRLRHSAEVGAAWDNFMRQSQSALTMPLPEGLAADREQAYSLVRCRRRRRFSLTTTSTVDCQHCWLPAQFSARTGVDLRCQWRSRRLATRRLCGHTVRQESGVERETGKRRSARGYS